MKVILLTLMLVAYGCFVVAQSVNFGIKGGLNVSSVSSTNNGQGVTASNYIGFNAGVFADIGLGGFSIQPAVLYTTKGGQTNYSGSYDLPTSTGGVTTINYSVNDKITLGYIEVPVNLLYHIPVPIGKVFFGGGPYVAYGITDTEKEVVTQSNTTVPTTYTTNPTYGSGSKSFKNPDFGINILGGLMINKGISLSVGYDFGLANLSNTGGSTKNNVFDVSLGYSFL